MKKVKINKNINILKFYSINKYINIAVWKNLFNVFNKKNSIKIYNLRN